MSGFFLKQLKSDVDLLQSRVNDPEETSYGYVRADIERVKQFLDHTSNLHMTASKHSEAGMAIAAFKRLFPLTGRELDKAS